VLGEFRGCRARKSIAEVLTIFFQFYRAHTRCNYRPRCRAGKFIAEVLTVFFQFHRAPTRSNHRPICIEDCSYCGGGRPNFAIDTQRVDARESTALCQYSQTFRIEGTRAPASESDKPGSGGGVAMIIVPGFRGA
jgi:hypothetical protein